MTFIRLRGAPASLAVLLTLAAAAATWAACPPDPGFNGLDDNATDEFGYYYSITGGKFPTGAVPNGDNASGGTFRYLQDSEYWSTWYPAGLWLRDDWFPENAGLALTLRNDGAIVYDNNGLEDGTQGDFYVWADASDPPSPGLYRGYNMANNFDWIYATFFRLLDDTTFDTLIGYFDGNGVDGAVFDPNGAGISYRMGVWSAEEDPSVANRFMPVCASFTGDVFNSDEAGGVFEPSYTGVDRVFPPGPPYEGATDPIWRLVLHLPEPVTLPAGEYFFSHHVLISRAVRIDVRPGNADNKVNTNAKQLVPIAIFSDADFDAPSEIDLGTIEVRGASVSETRFDVEDVDGDGIDDLVVYLRARDLQKPSDSECMGPAKLRLTGSLFTGDSFSAVDDVTYLGPDCN